jgi:hypothetical protein
MRKVCASYRNGTVVVLCCIIIGQPSTEVTKTTFATTDKIRFNVKKSKGSHRMKVGMLPLN